MKICIYCGNLAYYVCCGETNGIEEVTEEEYAVFCEGDKENETN